MVYTWTFVDMDHVTAPQSGVSKVHVAQMVLLIYLKKHVQHIYILQLL